MSILTASVAVVEMTPSANPRDSWPAWCDERWTIADEGPEGEMSPTWDAAPFEPDPLAAAYAFGFELGLAGEYPKVPAHYSEREAYHFTCGRLAGFSESPEGREWAADMADHQDRIFAEYDSYRDSDPSEVDGFAPGYYS